MYLPGHLGLGLLAAAVIVTLVPGRRWAVAASAPVVLASAPDVDLFLASVPHRGVTHTVWAAVAMGAGLAVVAGAGARRWGTGRRADAGLGFGGGVVAGLTHLLGDVLTPMGVRPFHPLLPGRYSLDLVAARNPEANLALLCAGCLAVGLVLVRERGRWVAPARERLRMAAVERGQDRGARDGAADSATRWPGRPGVNGPPAESVDPDNS